MTVFGSEVECFPVTRDGQTLALIQGISHEQAKETENLALKFKRCVPDITGDKGIFAQLPEDVPADVFQIAVLHCAVGGAGEGHAPYAPCSLTDLTGAGFDYWALGHVHQGKILSEKPHVVYPGSVQGMHINETGLHGCCIVRVTAQGIFVDRFPLASVVWEKVRFALDTSTESLDALIDVLAGKLTDKASRDFDTLANKPSALFCRVSLEGNTDMDAELRRPGSLETVLGRLRDELASWEGPVRVWVKDIVVATAPVRNFGMLAGRDDLVGEIVRLSDSLRDDPERARDMVERASSAIMGNAKLKKILSGAAPDEDVTVLADEARSLLCSLLEDEA